MAVTSYYSIGGEILGEETSATRRDYLTDALGSVTGTVTAAGTMENSYRYKPYGEQLSKAGTGSDPKFLWNGKSGYRNVSQLTYARSRNIQLSIGRWTTESYSRTNSDDLNLFAYCHNNPIIYFDYWGTDIIGWYPYRPEGIANNPGFVASMERDCQGKTSPTGLPPHGVSKCNPYDGNMYSVICNTPYMSNDECGIRFCIILHEDSHDNDRQTCCHALYNCINGKKHSVKDCVEKWKAWFDGTTQASECRAHTISYNCCNKPCPSKDPDCKNDWDVFCKEEKKLMDKACAGGSKIGRCPFNPDGSFRPNAK